MGIIAFNPGGQTTLRKAYLTTLITGYNATLEVGRYDKACANTMVGFLSASVIALRLAGDEVWASKMELAGKELIADWTSYQTTIPNLVAALKRN